MSPGSEVDLAVSERRGRIAAPNRSFRCDYVARQLAVKRKYRLWLTPAEKAAIATVLSSCPDQALPPVGIQIIRHSPRRGSGGGSRRLSGRAARERPEARPGLPFGWAASS
jgi:hypothetical protein